MKLLNNEIVGAASALQEIRNEKMPVRVSMDLAKLALKLDEPMKVFDEVRSGLVKTYQITSKVEDGKTVLETKGKPEDIEKFITEINELLSLEVEVVVSKVKLPEKIAGTCDKCNHNMDVPLQLTQGTLIALAKLVEVA